MAQKDAFGQNHRPKSIYSQSPINQHNKKFIYKGPEQQERYITFSCEEVLIAVISGKFLKAKTSNKAVNVLELLSASSEIFVYQYQRANHLTILMQRHHQFPFLYDSKVISTVRKGEMQAQQDQERQKCRLMVGVEIRSKMAPIMLFFVM